MIVYPSGNLYLGVIYKHLTCTPRTLEWWPLSTECYVVTTQKCKRKFKYTINFYFKGPHHWIIIVLTPCNLHFGTSSCKSRPSTPLTSCFLSSLKRFYFILGSDLSFFRDLRFKVQGHEKHYTVSSELCKVTCVVSDEGPPFLPGTNWTFCIFLHFLTSHPSLVSSSRLPFIVSLRTLGS